MTNKEKYNKLLETDTSIPIFSRDWWMDALCGEDNWDVLLVEKNDEIIASLPYYKKKKYGLTVISQPPLTQTNGIWIKYPEGQKYARKLSYEKEVMNDIITQIEKLDVDYFNQNFHYSVTNWLPFYWKGFRQTTRYTYIIDDLSNIDNVFLNLNSNVRGKIRKAEKTIKVTENRTLTDFYEINKMTFDRQKIEMPYSYEFLEKKDRILAQMGKRKLLFAEDENGRLHSSLYLIWDEQSSYLHMLGSNPQYRNSGGGILLAWEAIKITKNSLNLNIFDFEGSMIEGVESVRRAFGAIQKPYFNITYRSRRMRLAHHTKELLKAITNK